jgi:hypothetical protein
MAATGNSYDDKVWKAIKKEWTAGQLSLSDISRTYGPSRTAIRKKAKADNWPARGSLANEVRLEIESQLLEDEVPDEVPPKEAEEIVESAAKRGVAVVRKQRKLLARLLRAADGTLEELENMQHISKELLSKKKSKGNIAMVSALSKAKIDTMKAVSTVFNQAIPLERIAFSLDSDKGAATPIRYVAPDYKKPANTGLSEDDWEDEE